MTKPDFEKMAREILELASYGFVGEYDGDILEDEITKALESAYKSRRESIKWPSDEEMAKVCMPEMDCYTNESARGVFAAYRWLKQRMEK